MDKITTERILLMATLPETTLNYNRKIKLTNDGGDLSSDTGNFLFREFEEKIGFFSTLMRHLKINDTRKYYVHSNEQLLRRKLYQMIADYTADDAADPLTNDPVFKAIIGTDALASQPSLSRFLNRFDETSVEQLYQANQELLDKVHAHRGAGSLILDLDSTHADRRPEQTGGNFYYSLLCYKTPFYEHAIKLSCFALFLWKMCSISPYIFLCALTHENVCYGTMKATKVFKDVFQRCSLVMHEYQQGFKT